MPRLLLCLVLALGLAAFSTGAGGQSFECLLYDRSLLVSPCSVYNPSSWAYVDTSTETVSGLINYTNAFVDGIRAFPSTPECGPWVTTWFCQNPTLSPPLVYPLRNCPIDGLLLPPASAVATPTCLDMCRSFLAACQPAFQSLGPGVGALLPDTFCDGYSNDGVTVDGVTYACWNVTPTANPAPGNVTCPDYSVATPAGCRPACPSPEYTADQVFNIGLMQQIVGWISIVSASLLAAVWLIKPNLRRFPSRMVLFLLISTIVLSLAFILATFVGGNVGDVWCGDVDHYAADRLNNDDRTVNDAGLCVFQGWNIVLGTLLVGHWWAGLSVNAALLVQSGLDFKTFKTNWRLELAYHAVCWTLPLVLSIIAVAATKISYEPFYAFCFISSSQNNAWQIALWFVPMGLCLLVGTVASLYAVVMLLVHMKRLSSSVFMPVIVRILACAVFLACNIAIIFAAQIYATANEDSNAVLLIIYLVCIYGNNPEDVCRRELTFSTQYGLFAASTFFMAAAGIFMAMFFSTSASVWRQSNSTSVTSRNSTRGGSTLSSRVSA